MNKKIYLSSTQIPPQTTPPLSFSRGGGGFEPGALRLAFQPLTHNADLGPAGQPLTHNTDFYRVNPYYLVMGGSFNIVTGLTLCGLMTEFTSCGFITATVRDRESVPTAATKAS